MHTIQAHTTSVSLFTSDGKVRTFKSYAAALKALGIRWIAANVGEHFCAFTGFETRYTENGVVRKPCYSGAYAIMRNDRGEPVTAATFYALNAKPFTPWWNRRYSGWNGEGPVPGTGKGHNGHYCRRVGTTSEKRMAQMVDPEEPAPRAARNVSNLPDSWDDYGVAARADISWKRFRKTRWKAPRD